MEIKIKEELTAYQQEVWDWLGGDPFESGKVAILKSVRQSGKSFFCQIIMVTMALNHPGCTSAIYEPTLALARNVFKSIYKALEKTGLVKIANSQLLEIELVNGSTILFKSTEQTSRGLTITGILILDECAYLDDEQIYTILPLVNAHNAPIIIASTPFTEDGYFYQMYLKGLEGGKNIRTFDWAKHPEISRFLTDEKKALYKQMMSRQKYRTEVEGEFLADDGLLFSGMDKCLGIPNPNEKIVYVGIDFATGSEGDYSVLTIMNNAGQMVKMHRTNNLTPMQQVDWMCGILLELSSHYTIRTILAEQNSIGKVYIDAMRAKLRGKNLTITEWNTSNKSKRDLVTTLQIAFENGQITILDNPILLNELKRYQAEINNKTKVVTYNGYGANDDCVMSLMFAYWAYKKGLGTFRISVV